MGAFFPEPEIVEKSGFGPDLPVEAEGYFLPSKKEDGGKRYNVSNFKTGGNVIIIRELYSSKYEEH